MRLIDADAVVISAERVAEFYKEKGDRSRLGVVNTVIEIMKSEKASPTVDAAPVVRCRNCIRRKTLRNGSHVCPYSTVDLDLDGFCNRGKRKDDVSGCK